MQYKSYDSIIIHSLNVSQAGKILSFLIHQFAETPFYKVSLHGIKVNESSDSISRPGSLSLGTSLISVLLICS